jgi:hypothetical protein
MSVIFVEVAKGNNDFLICRDGATFEKREGETITLIGESFVSVDGFPGMHFIYGGELGKPAASHHGSVRSLLHVNA